VTSDLLIWAAAGLVIGGSLSWIVRRSHIDAGPRASAPDPAPRNDTEPPPKTCEGIGPQRGDSE